MGDNWMKQTQFYTKLSYSINPTSQLDFSFSSGISNYGYSNSKSYLVNESGRPVNSGSITINDDGVMKKITVNPHNFMQGRVTKPVIHTNCSIKQVLIMSA